MKEGTATLMSQNCWCVTEYLFLSVGGKCMAMNIVGQSLNAQIGTIFITIDKFVGHPQVKVDT